MSPVCYATQKWGTICRRSNNQKINAPIGSRVLVFLLSLIAYSADFAGQQPLQHNLESCRVQTYTRMLCQSFLCNHVGLKYLVKTASGKIDWTACIKVPQGHWSHWLQHTSVTNVGD